MEKEQLEVEHDACDIHEQRMFHLFFFIAMKAETNVTIS
jgi:hypothetical protein